MPLTRARNFINPAQDPRRAIRRPGWWSWLDRPLQRIALREIADDPHLLSDLGLSREEALREAAKPFWR